jgi:hypothetical protein
LLSDTRTIVSTLQDSHRARFEVEVIEQEWQETLSHRATSKDENPAGSWASVQSGTSFNLFASLRTINPTERRR